MFSNQKRKITRLLKKKGLEKSERVSTMIRGFKSNADGFKYLDWNKELKIEMIAELFHNKRNKEYNLLLIERTLKDNGYKTERKGDYVYVYFSERGNKND